MMADTRIVKVLVQYDDGGWSAVDDATYYDGRQQDDPPSLKAESKGEVDVVNEKRGVLGVGDS
jgi:hypothetical protein